MKKENLLLLHGALGSKVQLRPLKQILEQKFNVFDLNFEGHGDVYSEQDFSIDLFASNVRDFLKEQNLENTHIFGYSMGGYVALHLANHKPSLVNKIVTLGTKFDWNPEGAAREIKMLNPEKVEEKIPAFAGYLNKLHSALSWKVVMHENDLG